MGGFIPDLAAGSVSALVTLSYSASYAALVFSGPTLEPFLPAGLHVALIAAALVALVLALCSSLPFAIGGPDSNATAVLAIMAASLAGLLVARGLPGQLVAGAVLLMLAASAVVTGLLVFLLGVLRWGCLVRLLPYPVAGGFLAGSGFLVLSGAFKVLTGQSLTWSGLQALPTVPGLAWITALAVAAALLIVPRLYRHFLLVPGVIVAGILVFYLGLGFLGGNLDTARTQGLLMIPIEEGARVWPWRFVSEAPWGALLTEWKSFLAMVVVVIVTILLNAAGLELATHREVDLDRELRINGLANMTSGLGGGMVGYLSVSRSLLNYQAGAVSRLAGMWTAALCAAVALVFTSIVFYAPRPVLAGLLIYLGFALLREWLWDAFFKLPLREYMLIVAILVLIAAQGIITGVAVGLLVASGFFAYSYSRANYIRHSLSGSTHRSNKERSLEESVALRERGGIARALCLQGYLFFALASSLVETCRGLITREGVRYLLLDFRMVQGLDASAALGFAKLHHLCARSEATLGLSGLRPELRAVLQQMRFLPNPEIHVVPDLDHGLEWLEDRVLATAALSPLVSSTTMAGSAQEVDLHHMLAAHFSPDALQILLGLCETVQLEPGATLIRRGEAGDALYFIERGEVSVLVPLSDAQHKRVRALAPGTIVGEMALYSGQPRSADVVAATACRVRRLTGERFARLQRDHPMVANQFHRFVVTLLSERLAAVNEEIRALL
ncbi:MAG: SLC26A/SulP transporter family protein [Candidatus Rokuibacteriota bacterium]